MDGDRRDGAPRHLVAAPDKFRGTASAGEVAAAIANGAHRCGWSADEAPMADGGEGLLDAVGGSRRTSRVAGPLGDPVDAEWCLLERDGAPVTAVIESACAAGRALIPHPSGTDPVNASTNGIGELVLAAVEAGAQRVVVGCGGSATTDGGLGAITAIGDPGQLRGIELVAAVDVVTSFREAAAVFGPQKGASPAQVKQLTTRLVGLASHYRQRFGVEVAALPGGGAAGGLAGGLAALGGSIQPGFDLVADMVGLGPRLARAHLVVTGEGCLDRTSFDGKVVGSVASLAAGRVPVLCVVGSAQDGLADGSPGPAGPRPAGPRAGMPWPMTIVDLAARVGPERARAEVLELVEEAVVDHLSAW